jgi:hypothetical protein
MTRPARAAVLLAALAAARCGGPRVRLPGGSGTPAADGAAVLAQATAACRSLHTLTAEIHVSGRVRGHRVSGRLSAGFASTGALRIEAIAPFGAPIFILVARGDRASLLLPRDGRIVRDAPADRLLDALIGIQVTPAALWTLVSACPEPAAIDDVRQFGDDWRRLSAPPDGTLYLRRTDAGWRVVASVTRPDRSSREADYLRYDGAVPTLIHLSAGGEKDAATYAITLDLSQIDTNTTLGPDVFRLDVPPAASPMTLDELRRAGPLAVPGGSGG